MPTCQKQTPGYMDLIGVPSCIDNPEYLMGSNNINHIINNNNSDNCNKNEPPIQLQENKEPQYFMNKGPVATSPTATAPPPTQTLGIPLSPTEVNTETTSEHEYYNDLQRELQPLHKHETTV
jgi:L1 cell adhesion molecule